MQQNMTFLLIKELDLYIGLHNCIIIIVNTIQFRVLSILYNLDVSSAEGTLANLKSLVLRILAYIF